jgi:hypothetical protein
MDWQQIKKNLDNRRWRLNNLYKILTDKSEVVDFKMNEPQTEFFGNLWYWNLILKARQLGFTTLIDLLMLDACLFNDNIHAGIIAHNLKSAQKIFYNKVQWPYQHLPEALKKRLPQPEQTTTLEMRWSNGSQLWVGTSMRSGTLRMLHISELGKLCAKFPEKAREIQTGALPTLHEGGWLFVESTAEGAGGMFYDMAIASQSLSAQADKEQRKLNKEQARFHFFPWYEHPGNKTDPAGIHISDELAKYFNFIEKKLDITLSIERRAWYALKKDGPAGLGKYMKRENPSYPEEAFEQSIEGAIWGEEMSKAYADGRVGFYPHLERLPVSTFWDLGYNHATSVIFVQFNSEQIRIIDHHSERGRGAAYHAKVVKEKPYNYHKHYFPHDVMQHEKGSGIILGDVYAAHGIPYEPTVRPKLKEDSIEAGRNIFNQCVFHADTTKELRKSLACYRYEWDEDKMRFGKVPVDDWTADDADAFQVLGTRKRIETVLHENPNALGMGQRTTSRKQDEACCDWNPNEW